MLERSVSGAQDLVSALRYLHLAGRTTVRNSPVWAENGVAGRNRCDRSRSAITVRIRVGALPGAIARCP